MVEVKRPQAIKGSQLSGTLLLASLTSLGLFAGGAIRNGDLGYSYMLWNLFLAWIPLLLIVWLIRMLKHKRWSSWQGIALSVAWLGFLPNSFYMISDYIHLEDTPSVDVLYDAVMLTSFVITGLMLGYISLYLFHAELQKRLPPSNSTTVINLVLLLSAFAIYLGRDLRWNTWDLFVNPAGILFDVSDRLINAHEYPQMFVTVISFYALLAMVYYAGRSIIRSLQPSQPPDQK